MKVITCLFVFLLYFYCSIVEGKFTAFNTISVNNYTPSQLFFYGNTLYAACSANLANNTTPLIILEINPISLSIQSNTTIPLILCSSCPITIETIQLSNDFVILFITSTDLLHTFQITTFNIPQKQLIDNLVLNYAYVTIFPDFYLNQTTLVILTKTLLLNQYLTTISYSNDGKITYKENLSPPTSKFVFLNGITNLTNDQTLACATSSTTHDQFLTSYDSSTYDNINHISNMNCEVISISPNSSMACMTYTYLESIGYVAIYCWNYSEVLNLIPQSPVTYQRISSGLIYDGLIDPNGNFFYVCGDDYPLNPHVVLWQVNVSDENYVVYDEAFVNGYFCVASKSSLLPYRISNDLSMFAQVVVDTQFVNYSILLTSFDYDQKL